MKESIVAYNEAQTPNFFPPSLPYLSSSSPNKTPFHLYSSSWKEKKQEKKTLIHYF